MATPAYELDDTPLEAEVVPRPVEVRAPTGTEGQKTVGRILGEKSKPLADPIRMQDTVGVDDLAVAAISGALIGPTRVGTIGEPQRFKGKHLTIIRLAAQGYRAKEIHRYLASIGSPMSYARICGIIQSPKGTALLARMTARAAENLDVREMLQKAAPEATLAIIETMRTTQNAQLRAKIGFGLLDRAGFAPANKAEPPKPNGLLDGNGEALGKLADVLAEAMRVKEIPYTPAKVQTRMPSGSEIEVSPPSSLASPGGASVGTPSPGDSPSKPSV